jgi:hypothetical protein
MTLLGKRLALVAGVFVFTAIGLFATLELFFDSRIPSEIVDFKPTVFRAKADGECFYSIGDQLKRSNEIDPQAPTLVRGRIMNFVVAPDNQKIAVVVDGRLVIVGTQSVLRRIEPVGSIYRQPKPIGKTFFRDDNFQWARDSRVLYLIRDEYYESQGSQLYSNKGELWKYDIASGAFELVLKPFQSYSYFLGIRGGIYFSTPTPTGDLHLKYFDGYRVINIEGSAASDVSRDQLGKGIEEVPFFSFSVQDYERVLRVHGGVELTAAHDGPQELIIRHKPYLALTKGRGLKGEYYYCSDMLRSVFLPGDRYFLFNTRYCGNYNGQILIDTHSGQYERLPPETAIYRTLDTAAHSRTGSPAQEFWSSNRIGRNERDMHVTWPLRSGSIVGNPAPIHMNE